MAAFCSKETLQFSEPIGGSALNSRRYIFIGWPRGSWSFDQMLPKYLPENISEALYTLSQRSGISIRLYNNPVIENKVDIIVCPEMAMFVSVPIEDIGHRLIGFLNGDSASVEKRMLPGRHFFICTHGIRDRCCAKFGFGAVRKFRSYISEPNELKHKYYIWETSHLIGDRFAGTGIQFPEGRMFGRLNQDNILDVLCAWDKDLVYAPCYRGCIFLEDKEQYCESLARQYMYENALTGQVEIQYIKENSYKLTILAGEKVFQDTVCLFQKEFSFYSNCRELEKHMVQKKLRWVAGPIDFEEKVNR